MPYLKTYDAALAEIIAFLQVELGTQIIDITEGSVIRSLAEAVAFQVADLSERQERSILEAIPESTFRAFGFAKKTAQKATGTVDFYAPVPARHNIHIPKGTEVIAAGEQSFVTTVDGNISTGQIKTSVAAVAVEGGIAGNVPARAITRLGTGVTGVSRLVNPAPFSGGTDDETLAEQQKRFAAYLATLDRSGKAGLTSVAFEVTEQNERLDSVRILDRNDTDDIPAGMFQLLGYRRGGVSEALKKRVQERIHRYRAAGVYPYFTWVEGTPVNVRIEADCRDPLEVGYALERIKQVVAAYFAALDFGQKISYENVITIATTAHKSIFEVKLVEPSADVFADIRQRYELGTIEVTAL